MYQITLRTCRAVKTLGLVAVGMTLSLSLGSPATAEIRAGASSIDITPPIGGALYGYGARGTNTSTGVHDPLFARAVVVSDGEHRVALVALDLGSFGRPYTEAVRSAVLSRTGIEHVILTASHTHSAPRFDETFPTPDRPWLDELERRIVSAIETADSQLVVARIGVAYGHADLCHNRRRVAEDGSVEMMWANHEGRPTAPVDTQVGVGRDRR